MIPGLTLDSVKSDTLKLPIKCLLLLIILRSSIAVEIIPFVLADSSWCMNPPFVVTWLPIAVVVSSNFSTKFSSVTSGFTPYLLASFNADLILLSASDIN